MFFCRQNRERFERDDLMDEKGSRGCNMDSIFTQDQGQCVVCVQSMQFFTSAVE